MHESPCFYRGFFIPIFLYLYNSSLSASQASAASSATVLSYMAEVVDIIHKLTFETNPDVLQAVNKEFGTQLQQLQQLKQREQEYNALLSKTSESDIRNRKAIELLLQRNRQQYDAIAVSVGKQFAANEKLNTSLVKTGRNLSTLSFAGSQLLREAPAFTYSLQTGILALSNNIPILLDQLTQARASGASTREIFSALGSSIFGLTGLITIAVSALTIFAGKLFDSSKAAKENAASIDSASKAIDNYAKILKNAADFNDEGANAIKRNLEALKAQGVQAGETFAAEKRVFEGEQELRKQEAKDLNDRIKLYQRVAAAVSGTGRGSAAQQQRRFQQSVSGLPTAERDELTKAFNEGVLTRRSINERINQLNEEAKNKANEITVSEIEFNSQQREKEYQLRVQLTRRLGELEIEYAKLRLQRGKETFDRIQETNALELRENEEKLNQEIEDARKAGTVSLQVQQRFEQIRLQIRRQANEKLLQENLEYFQQEREDLQEVVNGLGSIFNTDRADTLNKIPDYSKEVSDEINRGLKKDEDRRKKEKEMIKDYLDYTLQTTAQTLQSIYEMQLYYLDKEIAARQDRVARAVELAEKGNTEILQSEREKLIAAQNERDKIGQRQLQLNALLQASSAAIAATQAIQTVTNAGATGDPYSAPVRIAAAVAALAAGFAFVTSLTQAFKSNSFKDGVIGIDGAGTETSDSIPARLSKGESVMTAKETKKYKEYLLAMRDGSFDKMLKTHEPVYIGGGNNYKPLEKKLDSVIDAIESNKVVARQIMDKNGISQAIETYKKYERQRFM